MTITSPSIATDRPNRSPVEPSDATSLADPTQPDAVRSNTYAAPVSAVTPSLENAPIRIVLPSTADEKPNQSDVARVGRDKLRRLDPSQFRSLEHIGGTRVVREAAPNHAVERRAGNATAARRHLEPHRTVRRKLTRHL